MKKTVVSTLLSMVTTTLVAQTTEPVVMTVAGKPVTRSEFEYAYNKNASIAGAVEKKTVAEYAQMYLDYKLKVAAAEAAHLDTLQSFRTEFMQYRDMQLTPFMVDQAYIDSIARQVWQATADQLKGKDMLRTAHILVMVRQGSSEAQYRQGRHKMDSIMTLLNNGADFAEVARTTSDDRGTAARGGELPWIGPGMTLQPYEDAAYALPRLLPFTPEFNIGAILSVVAVYLVSATETIGDTSALCNSALKRDPETKEMGSAICCDGFVSSVSGLFGCTPITSFSQNVGLAAISGVVNRFTIGVGAMVMIIGGVFPAIGAALTTIPQAVLGGCTIMMFGMGQGDDVCRILRDHGYTILERTRDYNDRERAVLAQYGRKEV